MERYKLWQILLKSIQFIEVGRDIYEATADAIEAKGVVKVSEHDILVPGYNCSRLSIK